MSSYLRDWLFGSPAPPATAPSVPTVELISPPASDDDDGEETETERDNDSPPIFPALNSAQRLQTTPRVLTDSQLMPPPPVPSLSIRQPGVPLSSSRNNTSTLSTLAVPPSTTKAPVKSREKVALAPGHSPLDWAALKTSGQDLRVSITINLAVIVNINNSPFQGVDNLLRIPPSILKQHNKRDDAWTAIYGKVYNITAYLSFHPGGVLALMRAAGRDGTKLFGLYISSTRLQKTGLML